MKLSSTLRIILFVPALFVLLTAMGPAPRKVSILGDSYSTFEGYLQPDTNAIWYFADSINPKRTDVEVVADTWWYQFLNDNALQLEQNNSFSGATVCNTGYRGEDYTGRAFIRRMHYLGQPDLILVFAATNDLWAKVPLGDDKRADWTDADLFAFRPAMNKLAQELPGLYPDAKVVFMLNDEIQGPIREAILSTCARESIPVVELENISKRAGHPDRAGMKEINRQLTQFLKTNNLL